MRALCLCLSLVLAACSASRGAARPTLGETRIVELRALTVDAALERLSTDPHPFAKVTADPTHHRLLIAVPPGHSDELARIVARIAELDVAGIAAVR